MINCNEISDSWMNEQIDVAFTYPMSGQDGSVGFVSIKGMLINKEENSITIRTEDSEKWIPAERIQVVSKVSKISLSNMGN